MPKVFRESGVLDRFKITANPTFLFYKGDHKLEYVTTLHTNIIERTIQKYINEIKDEAENAELIQGFIDAEKDSSEETD